MGYRSVLNRGYQLHFPIMKMKTWFTVDAHGNRIFRRPSKISIKAWTTLEPRHGGRPVFVQGAVGDPVPTKSEVIITGAMADYEEALARAYKDVSLLMAVTLHGRRAYTSR